MSQYDYKELREAYDKNNTQENLNALAEWFEHYDQSAWNGECFVDGKLEIYPIYKAINEDDFEIVGYSSRREY